MSKLYNTVKKAGAVAKKAAPKDVYAETRIKYHKQKDNLKASKSTYNPTTGKTGRKKGLKRKNGKIVYSM